MSTIVRNVNIIFVIMNIIFVIMNIIIDFINNIIVRIAIATPQLV